MHFSANFRLSSFPFQALRYKKAHVTHPELKATFCLPIIGVKKNPNSALYTSLGVITKGTVIEVSRHVSCYRQ
jgi:ribosomal protein S8E